MNWLERYVEGVKRYLPKKSRDDVGDELMSVLEDKLDVEVENQGRDLTKEELEAWVASQEHPMIVAAQYQNYPEIVAREFYPPYFLTLRIVIGIVLGVQVLTMGLAVLLGRVDVLEAFGNLFNGLLSNLLWAFGSVTLVFHFIGRHTSAKKLLKKWKVKDLPVAAGKWVNVPIGEKIFEIVVYLLMLVFFNGVYPSDWTIPGTYFATFNPDAYVLIPWINALLLLEIAQNLWVVLRPRWTKLKLIANLALSGLGLGILGMVFGIDPLFVLPEDMGLGESETKIRALAENSLNFILYVIGAIIFYEIIRDIYRIIKLKK